MDRFFPGHPDILDRMHDAVIVTDINGVITECNRAAEKIYNYSCEELVGGSVARLYPQAQLANTLDAAGHGEAVFSCRTKSGREIWINLSLSLLRDERGVAYGFVGFSIDITAHVINERALKLQQVELDRTEAKYHAIFESPFIGVASGTLEQITDVNETFCRLLGYPREEFVSGSVGWQDCTPTEYLPRDYEALRILADKGTCPPYEKEYVRQDGSRIRAIVGATLIQREPLEWSCFLLDVTENYRALSALRAGEMLASAARMGNALAHEINNPLASLTNILYLLRHGKQGSANLDLLVAGQEALERVSRITRQMIGVYSEREIATNFSVSDVVEDTLSSYAARTRAKNLRISKRVDLLSPSYLGSEPEFRRLFASLFENAVEHSRIGGVVRIRLHPHRQWSGDRRQGLRIVIADNGPGIAPAQLPMLFEPFHSTKTRKGSGLGLWMSRGIAEKNGGFVRVRSCQRTNASGTTVVVFLPDREIAQAASTD